MYIEKFLQFDIQLLSQNLGKRYFDEVFLPTLKSANITFLTSPGLGDYSHLAYLVRQLHLFEAFKQKLYVFIDLESFILDKDVSIKESISQLKSNFSKNNEHIFKKYQNSNFFELLHSLTYLENYSVTVIVDNFDILFAPVVSIDERRHALNYLDSVKKINPMALSFIFITQREKPTNLDLDLHHFETLSSSITLFKKDFLFDEESFDIGIKNREVWWDVKLSPILKEKMKELSLHDPSMLSIFLNLYRATPKEFENTLLGSIEGIFSRYSNNLLPRFHKLYASLQPATQKELLEGIPTDYLMNAGIIIENKPLSSLFEYYLHNKLYTGASRKPENVEDILTPMEQQIYKLLRTYQGELISKDEVAVAIWGDNWINNYNLATLDKHVSNLRKKLEMASPTEKILTLKNQGYTLT